MNVLDYFIIGLLSVGFILGFKDGIIRKIIGLTGLFIAILMSYKLSNPIGEILSVSTGIEQYLSEILAGITIFISIVFLASIIKRLVHPSDKVNNLLNQILGGIFGSLQIFFFLSIIFLILNIFDVPSEESKTKSLLYNPTYSAIPSTISFIFGESNGFKDIIKESIESKDSGTEKQAIE